MRRVAAVACGHGLWRACGWGGIEGERIRGWSGRRGGRPGDGAGLQRNQPPGRRSSSRDLDRGIVSAGCVGLGVGGRGEREPRRTESAQRRRARGATRATELPPLVPVHDRTSARTKLDVGTRAMLHLAPHVRPNSPPLLPAWDVNLSSTATPDLSREVY